MAENNPRVGVTCALHLLAVDVDHLIESLSHQPRAFLQALLHVLGLSGV